MQLSTSEFALLAASAVTAVYGVTVYIGKQYLTGRIGDQFKADEQERDSQHKAQLQAIADAAAADREARQSERAADLEGRKASFERELERLRSELVREADAIKHARQRELADFTIFTAKRHEVYAQTYASAFGAFVKLIGARTRARNLPNVTQLPADLAERSLVTSHVPKAVRDEYLRRWSEVTPGDEESLKEIQRAAIARYVGAALQNAFTYAEQHALYFSARSAKALDEFVAFVNGLNVFEPDATADAADFGQSRLALTRLKAAFQAELTGGSVSEGGADGPLGTRSRP